MNDTAHGYLRQTITALVALSLFLSVLGPVGMVAAQEVTTLEQSETDVTAAPGETVELTTTFSTEGLNGPGVEIQLPAGWTGEITDADGGFPNAEDGGNVLQVVWFEEGTYEVTYQIDVPENAEEGDYTVDVEGSGIDPATNGRIVESTQTTITVEEPDQNTVPTADAGDDQTVDEGDSVTLDASGSSDQDGDALTYQWTQTAGPDVTLSDADTATPGFTAPEVDDDETLTFEVEVSDGQASDTDTVDVTVQDVPEPNQEPTAAFTVDPASPEVGEDVTLDASNAEDPDGEIVSYEWSVDGETLDDTGETVTTSFDAAGDYDVALTVEDDDGATDTATQTVTVEESEAPAPETSVSLSPDSAEVVVGDTETYDVVVDNADGGVGAYDLTVSLDDPSVASITDFELGGGPSAETQNVTFADDGSSVSIVAALADTSDTGSVTIATVTVEGTSAGSSDLSVDVEALGTEAGESYDVTDENGASISVIELPPVGDFQNSPTDPDGDGLYEDINGDGEFNIVDVQALFANLDDDTIQNNPDKFDFNQDGKIDVVDVQKLFNEVP